MTLRTVLAALVFLPVVGSATLSPWEATDPKPWTVYGVELGKTKLPEVERLLGTAPPVPKPEHGRTAWVRCYRAPQGPVLYLFGDGDELQMFHLQRRPSKAFPADKCIAQAALATPPQLPHGLALGANAGPSLQAIGASWKQSYRKYSDAEIAAQKHPAPGGGHYKGEYRYLTVKVREKSHAVDRIEVSLGGETDW